MKLSKYILIFMMLGLFAFSQNRDLAVPMSPQKEEFHNTLSDYRNHAAAIAQGFTFDTFNPADKVAHYNFYEFKAPGYSWGNAGGWAVQHGISEQGIFNTRGIGQMYVSNSVKHATGDFAAEYVYASTDGGATAQSDEGFTLDTREGGETDDWFHGTVAEGAKPGTTLLPVTYVAGPHSQSTTTDGAFMLDITKGTISGVVTGPEKLVEGTSVHTMPVSAKLPPSTGIGIVNTVIPRVKKANVPETITLTDVRLLHGSFVAGKACLAGGWYPEQILITNIGTARNGLQDVTIVHKNPNGKDPNNPTSLWQGGVCGQYLSLDRNLARDGFRTSYEVVGATDVNDLAYVWNAKGSTKQNVLRVYHPPVLLKNLSRKDGVVTASFRSENQPYIFNHAATVVIADASSPSFDGTVHSPEYGDDLNRTLKWHQAGPDATASSATIDLPASYYGFHLYPGAEVLGPQVEGGVPLEPNSVDWSVGDVIENPHNPSFTMNGRMTVLTQNTLSSGFNSGAQMWGLRGSGISANYFPSVWRNVNPCSLYVGCGGTLEPIRWNTFEGPYRELIKIASAPLNQGSLITVGCDSRGCSHIPPYRLFSLQNGTMEYDPANGNFTVPRMTAQSFSGHLEGRITTTQIDLEDPKDPGHVLTLTNSNGRMAISSPNQKDKRESIDSAPQKSTFSAQSVPAKVITGPANEGGSASCAKGYTCTAKRGRLTVNASAVERTGTIASVRTTLPQGAICTATQNGGSSFFGIGSGNESASGFDVLAGVVLHGTLTVDYACQ
jgi:hypothetical protein